MNPQYVQSIHRAFSILESFSDEHPKLTLSEISAVTGLVKPTALRLIGNLVDMGYLISDGKYYSLSLRFITLGNIASSGMDDMQHLTSVMLYISNELGEHVTLNALVNDMRVPVKLIESKHTVTTKINLGKAYPLFAGSAGKTLLAFQKEEYITNYLNTIMLQQLTSTTITDKDTLLTIIKKIREEKICFSEGERVDHVWSCSVPVLNYDGNATYCITTGGPTYTFTPELKEKTEKVMREAYKRAYGSTT